MSESIIQYDSIKVKIDTPSVCEFCGAYICPEIIFVTEPGTVDYNRDYFNVLYRCTNCNEFFIVKYVTMGGDPYSYYYSNIISKKRYPMIRYPFENDFSDVSPKFKEIYNQSQLAESIGLDEICGMGYRKALEHLLRDYYDVKEGLLGQVISKIDNPQIQALAKISSWLGNDHAHYDVKHPQKTIDDIKRFIQAIVHHISMEIVTKEAIDYIENQ